MSDDSPRWHSLSIEKNVDIRINTIENIARTESVSLHFIVEHNENVLGESPSVKIDPNLGDNSSVHEIDYTVNYVVLCDQKGLIDALVSTPVIIKALINGEGGSISSLSDDSKKKSKFTAKSPPPPPEIFGICNVDLMPILLGEDNYTQKLRLETIGFDVDTPLTSLPLLSITLTQDDVPFFPAGETINYMTISVESIYNPPEYFVDNMEYVAGTIVYVDSEMPEYIIFNDGARTTVQDWEKAKSWNTLWKLPNRAALSHYKLDCDYMGVRNPFQEEFNLADEAHENVPRIVWNSMSRHIIREPGVESTKEQIAKYKYWPFQFMVVERNSGTAKTKSKERTSRARLFQCYIDAAELLFPGKRSIRVVEQLHILNPLDITERAGLDSNIFYVEGYAKELKEKDKKAKGSKYAQSIVSDSDGGTSTGLIGYNGKPTVIVIEIEFYQALVPSRLTPEFSQLVDELKATRHKKYVYTPNIVEQQYEDCIQKLTEHLTESYRDFREVYEKALRGDQSDGGIISHCNPKNDDELTCFTQYLYTSGIYVSVRSTLRAKVTTVLDQKFKIESNVVESVETQNFIASIYTYLLERMHMAMNKMVEGRFVDDQQDTVPVEKLYFYAEEALELGQLDEAKRFLTTAIARNKRDPEPWTRYAIFYMKVADLERATECVKEAILLKSRHRLALILYGGILYIQGDYQEAEIFFRTVTELYPRFIEGWTVLHIFYLLMEYCPGIEITLRIAEKCMKDKIRDTEISYDEPLSWSMIHCPSDSVYTIAATLLLKLGLGDLACAALNEDVRTDYVYYFMAVDCYLCSRFQVALEYLEEAENIFGMDYSIGSLMGHCYYQKADFKNAINCYEFVSTLFNRPDDLHLVEVRMGIYYLEMEDYQKAKKIFLNTCKISPSLHTWFGLGKSFYHLNEFDKAEAALTEANNIDTFNAEVWGYLCLLNLALDRYDEFVQCYRETVKNNLKNRKLWLTITESMEASGIAPPIITVDSEDESFSEINNEN